MTPDRRPGAVERCSTAVGLVAMLATPFTRAGSRPRFLATSAAVVAGASRSVAVDARRPEVGVRRALASAGLTAACATVAEMVGTWTGVPFGRYRYSRVLRPQIGGVPVHVALAWAAMVPAADDVAASLMGPIDPGRTAATTAAVVSPVPRASPLRRIGVGAVALTAWDAFLDPQMTRDGLWAWERPGRYRGVPIWNFVGWLLVSAGLVAVRRVVIARSDEPDPAHVATYGTVAALSTIAFATFWRDRVVALVGGVTMLPLAVVAWCRCRR